MQVFGIKSIKEVDAVMRDMVANSGLFDLEKRLVLLDASSEQLAGLSGFLFKEAALN